MFMDKATTIEPKKKDVVVNMVLHKPFPRQHICLKERPFPKGNTNMYWCRFKHLTYGKAISHINIQPFFIVVQHICPQGNNHPFGNTTIAGRKRPFFKATQLVIEIIQNICPWGKDHSSRNKIIS
jgi:hypothetical protein